MYPGWMHMWKHAQRHGPWGAHAGHVHHGGGGGEGGGEAQRCASGEFEGEFGSGSFGVRRPLRFLAYKLELTEAQVSDLARILDELKTERAQAAVDHRRTVSAFADAVAGEKFDDARAAEGAALRVKSATTLRDAVVKALGKMHALLDAEQRQQLAYLVRTGTLTI